MQMVGKAASSDDRSLNLIAYPYDMRVELHSCQHISLRHLLPAFALTVEPTHGRSTIRRRGFERLLVPGQRATIEPFEAVELCLDGSTARPASCILEIRPSLPPAIDGSLHRQISQRVFLQPEYAWNAGFISDLLDIPAHQLRRMLFSEGTALTELCRTQRLMRALLEAMAGQAGTAELKRLVGWPPQGDIEMAFYDRFGISMQTARALSRSAKSAASPGRAWPMAGPVSHAGASRV